jgi:hypothetical protein
LLQTDSASVLEERLEVLIVVVQIVFVTEELLNDFEIVRIRPLHVRNVGESAEPAGNIARRQGIALVDENDADHVRHGAVFSAGNGSDAHELELLGPQTKSVWHQAVVASDLGAKIGGNRLAIDLAASYHEERNRMNRHERAGRQSGPLDTLLSAVLDERAKVRKVGKLFAVNGRLCTDGQRLADLRDDDTDFARRHLDPRILFDGIERPEFPAQAGRQKVGLVSRLTVECDRIVFRKLARRVSLQHQAHFRGTNAVERSDNDENCQRQSQEFQQRAELSDEIQ